jgi:dienelactone hydrolase
MIITKEMDYLDGETLCRGFLAYNDALTRPAPAVLIAHDWEGRSKRVCDKAQELAAMGYIGFAVDMYGGAQLGKEKAERRALMNPLTQNREKLIVRITAAFDVLAQLPQVDKNRIAGIGYCFGGLCVLDLARSGADVKAVVSFHGQLTAPKNMEHTPIKSRVLILHGYDDPLVKHEQITQFAAEMNERNADWQVYMYGHTQHGFTNPEANDDEMGLHYNEQSACRSWESTLAFLKEM